ncbi:hypothetical protein LCGC14_1892000 [marine sediment metagenome]|uniref:Uncharacterized protein n=1 Tax=marine sediment metagenome TaxID=412755 RepID=A0A0F9IXA9_9ZZZZ
MTEKEKYVERLRELADFFEVVSDDLPRPNIPEVVYVNKGDIPIIIKDCHKLEKVAANGYISLKKSLDFGTLQFRISQEEVCERKVVGQIWVDTHTASGHFIDQVEYKCKPILKGIEDSEGELT